MNFEELRESWNQETIGTPKLNPFPTPGSRSAIARIRRNMRTEFAFTVFGYTATFTYVGVFANKHASIMLLLCASIFLAQSIYFFGRFIIFYRRSSRYDMNLRKNLRRFTYELELNMEIYRTYSICIAPLVILLWLSIMDAAGWTHLFAGLADPKTQISTNTLIWLILTVLISLLDTAVCLQFHMRFQYGIYLKELKKMVDDLDEE